MSKSDYTALIFVSNTDKDWMKYFESQMLSSINKEVKLLFEEMEITSNTKKSTCIVWTQYYARMAKNGKKKY